MDIMNLKSAWTLLEEEVICNDAVDETKILTSIHGKSKSEISKIKKVLHFKFIIATLAIIVSIGIGIASLMDSSISPLDFIFTPIESSIFFLLMALPLSIMLYFSLQAYRKIKLIQHSSLNLKENLESFIAAMQKAITFNIFSDTIITPFILAWIYYAYAFKDHQLGLDLRTALLFILPTLIGLLSYFFQKFIQRLKFGKYLDRLIGYLDSLQNKSSEL